MSTESTEVNARAFLEGWLSLRKADVVSLARDFIEQCNEIRELQARVNLSIVLVEVAERDKARLAIAIADGVGRAEALESALEHKEKEVAGLQRLLGEVNDIWIEYWQGIASQRGAAFLAEAKAHKELQTKFQEEKERHNAEMTQLKQRIAELEGPTENKLDDLAKAAYEANRPECARGEPVFPWSWLDEPSKSRWRRIAAAVVDKNPAN